jgi:hypothetical protein
MTNAGTWQKVFAKSLVDRYGVIADLAIHAPSEKGDQRNYHAHILLTTRKASVDEYNQLVLGEKSDIELSNAKRATLGLAKTQDDIKEIRQMGQIKLIKHWYMPCLENH